MHPSLGVVMFSSVITMMVCMRCVGWSGVESGGTHCVAGSGVGRQDCCCPGVPTYSGSWEHS